MGLGRHNLQNKRRERHDLKEKTSQKDKKKHSQYTGKFWFERFRSSLKEIEDKKDQSQGLKNKNRPLFNGAKGKRQKD